MTRCGSGVEQQARDEEQASAGVIRLIPKCGREAKKGADRAKGRMTRQVGMHDEETVDA